MNKKNEVMTIIIAIKCDGGAVIVSDGRVVRLDEYRAERKIFRIGKKLLIGLAGTTGVIKRIVRSLDGLADDLGSEESISKLERELANIYRYHKQIYAENFGSQEEFNRQFYGQMLAIDDKNIYVFYFDGFPEPCTNYEAIGSASSYVRTLLEAFYETNISIERACELGVYCILQAMRVSRDIGEPIQVGVVRSDGEAEILDPDKVRETIERINGRERILREVWSILSRKPELQEKVEEFIKTLTSI
jgi:20S proteasome alpha/beta subunit